MEGEVIYFKYSFGMFHKSNTIIINKEKNEILGLKKTHTSNFTEEKDAFRKCKNKYDRGRSSTDPESNTRII